MKNTHLQRKIIWNQTFILVFQPFICWGVFKDNLVATRFARDQEDMKDNPEASQQWKSIMTDLMQDFHGETCAWRIIPGLVSG